MPATGWPVARSADTCAPGSAPAPSNPDTSSHWRSPVGREDAPAGQPCGEGNGASYSGGIAPRSSMGSWFGRAPGTLPRPIAPASRHARQAAEYWLKLGKPAEALAELQIAKALRQQPETRARHPHARSRHPGRPGNEPIHHDHLTVLPYQQPASQLTISKSPAPLNRPRRSIARAAQSPAPLIARAAQSPAPLNRPRR